RAYVFYDTAALYVGFRCDEPDMAAVRAECTAHDGPVWTDDCVELFLQASDTAPEFHIIANTVATTYEAKDGEATWDPRLKAAAYKGEAFWTVEIALPWDDIGGCPEAGEAWGANFCREDHAREENSTWGYTRGSSFGSPEHFGRVVFAAAPVRLDSLELAAQVPGVNIARLQLDMPGVDTAKLLLPGIDEPRPVASGEALDAPYLVGLGDRDVVLEARVGERPVWRYVAPCTLEPRPRLERLEGRMAAWRETLGALRQDRPLRGAVEEALTDAQDAADAFRAAMSSSLATGVPVDTGAYKKLNAAVLEHAARLDAMHWPVWTKSNWLDLARGERPERVDDANCITVTPLINEYESENVVITNLGPEPLRVRVTAADLNWIPEIDSAAENLLRNGSLDAAGPGGVPEHWRFVAGDRSSWRMEEVAGRGHVAAISASAQDDTLSVRQSIDLDPDKEYTLSFWVKSEQASADVQVGVINSGWTWSRFTAPIAGTSDWRQVRLGVRPRVSPSHEVVIWGRPGATGTVWLDDISLVEGPANIVTFPGTAPELAVADWQELRGDLIVADPLIPLNIAGRLDVPPGESRQIWITLPARNLPPGRYESELRIQPLATAALQGAPRPKAVAIRLEMPPLRLPTHADFAVYNWDYALSSGYKLGERYLDDLVAHKVNFFLVQSSMPRPDFDDEGNPVGDIDYAARDAQLRPKLRYAREVGGQIMFSYGVIRSFKASIEHAGYPFEFMDEKWQRAFRYTFTHWVAHLKALGLDYADYAVQVWDEATGDRVAPSIEGARFIREIDPNVRLMMDGAQSVDEVKQFAPYIDVWVPVFSSLRSPYRGPELLELYRSLGTPVYAYTCSVFMKRLSPYTYHRLKPWDAAQLGLDGVFYWDYNSWRGDPWNDFDGPMADCGAVYNGT
ncbi:MAG: carbohydrate binding domain-containing protein, partial [Candidatus Hydrogenedentes bacterium]|nr:carbohydrate binding domain-containing protein [Candidatus Hydrogenedentota bacterium]